MPPRTVVADLGWCLARLHIDRNNKVEKLVIVSPADTDGHYSPPENVTVYTERGLITLRDLLVRNLPPKEEPS